MHAQHRQAPADVFDKLNNYTEQQRQSGAATYNNYADQQSQKRLSALSIDRTAPADYSVLIKRCAICLPTALLAGLLVALGYFKWYPVRHSAHRRKHRVFRMSNVCCDAPLVQRTSNAIKPVRLIAPMVPSLSVPPGRPRCDCCRNELSDLAIASVLAFMASGYRNTRHQKLS